MKKLSVMELLKRASKLLFGNINLFLFLCFCSLPLFCFLIFFELSLQTTVSLTYQFLLKLFTLKENLPENDFILFSEKMTELISEKIKNDLILSEKMNDLILSEKMNDLIPWLIQTSLLYFFPFTFIDLLTTTTIVSASSLVYKCEEEPLGMLDLVRRSFKLCQNRVGGCVITSLYVLLWSTSVFLFFFFFFFLQFLSGSTSYLSLPYYLSREHQYRSFRHREEWLFDPVVVLNLLIQCTLFIFLTAKFSKWSAGWNIGLVVSALEDDEDGQGIYGSDALSLSAWFRRGHEKRDLWLMLMFLVPALAMRMPCFCFKCSESSSGNGVLYTSLYVGLICVGNLLKWVTCLVCYHDCKTKVLMKLRDVEQAKPLATTTEVFNIL